MAEGVFLQGSTMGHVVRMTATGALGITFVFLVDAANLFWLSQSGEPQLVAAVGFAYAIQFFSVSVGVGLMIATTAMVSRKIGEGDRATARVRAGAAMATAMGLQFCVACAIITFRHDLVAFAGASGETARLSARYLAMTMLSLVPMAGALVCSGTLRADGFGAKAMMVTLISGCVLMVLDPILILWMELGLDGAAIGLVLFRFCLLGLAVFFAIYQHDLVGRVTPARWRAFILPFAALAGPAIVTQLATPVGNYLLTVVMSQFGDAAVAAWAVVGRLTVLVFGGIFALSGSIGGIFGQNAGAGQFDRLRSTYRDAVVFVLGYTAVMWAVLQLLTPAILGAFGLSSLGADVLRAFTQVGVGGFMFIGLLFVANAAFNSLGRPLRATLANWVNDGALSWPLALWLASLFGAAGVVYGQAMAAVIAGGLASLWAWRFVRGLGPETAVEVPKRPPPGIDRYRRR